MALRLRRGRATQEGGAPAPAVVSETDARRTQPQDPRGQTSAAAATQPQPEQPALLDEVLIEEVSIDGMCGVY